MRFNMLTLCLILASHAAWGTPEAYPGLGPDAYHPLHSHQLKSKNNKLTLPLFNAEFSIPQGLKKKQSANSVSGSDISFEQSNEHGHINVTLGQNSIFGSWHHKDKDFRLTTDASGSWLVELPTSHLIEDSCGTPHSPPSSSHIKNAEKLASTTIDILVVHDRALALRYPGNLMQSRVNHYMHVANQTFANSGLDLDVRLVGIEELSYNHNNSNSYMLYQMQSTLSNNTIYAGLENLPQLRTETGADLIIAIRPHDIETRGNCGLAYYPANDFNNTYGLNMVSDGMSSWSLCSDMVFVHEIGHNLGAAHQYGQGGGTYEAQGSAFIKLFQFNTVMGSFGTGANNRSKRLPMFSNPHLQCGGYSCGNSVGDKPSNNVAVINNTKNAVANYFPTTSSAPHSEDYNRSSRDFDQDGVNDWQDHFPFDASETADTDQDGYGNNSDIFPNNPSEHADNDMDGLGDNADDDDDNDGHNDDNDAFPLLATEQTDMDGDGIGDFIDAFPTNDSEHIDFDADGLGDYADRDDDNDGVEDVLDGIIDYQQDILVINEGNNRILRFDAQTGQSLGIEVLPEDGLLTFQSDLAYDFEKHILYYTSSSSVKKKNMMQREGSQTIIPAYSNNEVNIASLGTGFPTALIKTNGRHLIVSKIDKGSLSNYDIVNQAHIKETSEQIIAPIEFEESFIDIEYNNEFYLLGLHARLYHGTRIDNITLLPGFHNFNKATDLAIHPDGSILVSDFQKKQIVQIDKNTGVRIKVFANLNSLNIGNPSSLAITKDDYLLVATKYDNSIHKFDVFSGEYLGVLVDGQGLDSPHKMILIPSLKDRFHHDASQTFSPNAGMWFNPEANGTGFDVGVFGNRLQVIWFTYDSDGAPIWYYTAGDLHEMNYQSPIYETKKIGEEATTFKEVGALNIDFENERKALVTWQIGDIDGEETLDWHFFDTEPSPQNYTGMWTRPDSPGWGASITTQGNKTVALSFLYDQTGSPRWVNSNNGIGLSPLSFNVGTFFNDSLCPGCSNGSLNEVIVSGQMTFDFSDQPYWSSNMTWPSPLTGSWLLDQSPLIRITSPPTRPR